MEHNLKEQLEEAKRLTEEYVSKMSELQEKTNRRIQIEFWMPTESKHYFPHHCFKWNNIDVIPYNIKDANIRVVEWRY